MLFLIFANFGVIPTVTNHLIRLRHYRFSSSLSRCLLRASFCVLLLMMKSLIHLLTLVLLMLLLMLMLMLSYFRARGGLVMLLQHYLSSKAFCVALPALISFRWFTSDLPSAIVDSTAPHPARSSLVFWKGEYFVKKKYCEIHSVVFATWKIFVAIIQLLVIKKLDLLVVLVGNNYFCWSRDFVTNKVAVWKSHSLIFWWSNFGNRNLLWRDYWWSENLIYWFKCEFWKNYFCCKNEQFSRVN